jgi:kynurenine formamidase
VIALVVRVAIVWMAIGLAPAASQQRSSSQAPQPGERRYTDNRADVRQFEEWMRTLSNWRRWGDSDEIGAVNLITPSKRQSAMTLARTGAVLSLSRPHRIDAGMPNAPFSMAATTNPAGFSSDRIEMSFHGVQITHIDALCHFSYNGQTYNGYPWDQVVTKESGCSKLGIGNMRDRLVTRAVLVDIPRLKGLPYLEPGTHIYREDLVAWERRANVRLSPGDALLLRTGRWARDERIGPSATPSGYDLSAVPFFKERDIAIIGSDWTHDVGTVEGVIYPVHRFAIVALGMTLLDALDLEELSARAAALNRWEFLLAVEPTNATNATGSPVNPLVMF